MKICILVKKTMSNYKFYLVITLTCLLNIGSFAQKTKISFEVAGVCGMCEERIENALDTKGITYADWSQETKICQVTFNASKITTFKSSNISKEKICW